jgi:WD40 repeat protein
MTIATPFAEAKDRQIDSLVLSETSKASRGKPVSGRNARMRRILNGCSTKNTRAAGYLKTIAEAIEFVWSMAFSPDGKRIASGSSDTTLKVWDATTGQETLHRGTPALSGACHSASMARGSSRPARTEQ